MGKTFAAAYVLATCFAGVALQILVPDVLVAVSVWSLAICAWLAKRSAVALALQHRVSHTCVIELLPFAIALQIALDLCVPMLGDMLVLVGNLVAITSIVRASPFPGARLVRRQP